MINGAEGIMCFATVSMCHTLQQTKSFIIEVHRQVVPPQSVGNIAVFVLAHL